MSPPEHFVIGLATGNLAYAFFSLDSDKSRGYGKLAAAASISAVLPDIDSFFGSYGSLDPKIGHRGMTHSFLGILTLGFLVTLCLSAISTTVRSLTGYYHWLVARLERNYGVPSKFKYTRHVLQPFEWKAFAIIFLVSFLGGLSHILADLPTPKGNWQGLPLFFPFSNKRYGDLNLIGWYDIWGFWTVTAAIALTLPVIIFSKLFRIKKFKKISMLVNSLVIFVHIYTFQMLYSHIKNSRYENENQWYIFQKYTVIKQLPEKIQIFTDKSIRTFVIIFKQIRK